MHFHESESSYCGTRREIKVFYRFSMSVCTMGEVREL